MNDKSIDRSHDNEHAEPPGKGRRRSAIPLALAAAAALAPLGSAVDADAAPSFTDQFATAFVPGKVDAVEGGPGSMEPGLAIVE